MVEIQLPEKVYPIATGKARYKILYGGRASAKSWSFAGIAIIRAMQLKTRFLCAREFQNSIADSVHRLLSDFISRHKIGNYFSITNNMIKSANGSEFIFRGIRNNVNEIKSMEGIDVCWITEAAKVSKTSWDILVPTIRKEGSEIWMDYNPDLADDETHSRFVVKGVPDSIIVKMNYTDNPWLPEVLKREIEYDKEFNPDKYEHVWQGETRKHSEAQVFRGKVEIREFVTPPLDQVYQNRFFFGADWGFSRDPTIVIRMFIQDRTLFIDYEAGGVGIEIPDLPKLFDTMPEIRRWKIKADNARPETISFMRNQGFIIEAARKWKGCVEEGVEYIRGFEKIVIHPRCPISCDNFKMYSYKVDRNTEEILPILVKGEDHSPDAARYGLDDYIGREVSILDAL